MFWEKFVFLCNKHNTNPNAVCATLNFSNATATHWKNGSIPRDTTLKKVADYFSVTVDYLLGKEKSPSSEENGLSDTQKEIIALFDVAPPELQVAALAVLKSAEHRPPAQDVDQADK